MPFMSQGMREAFDDYRGTPLKKPLPHTLKPLEEIAAEILVTPRGLPFSMMDLIGKSRVAPLVRVRQAFFHAAREAGHTLAAIGTFTNRGHDTVLLGIRAHQRREHRP